MDNNRNRTRQKLTRTQIRANKDHLSMLDQIADMRSTTRTQLIRESIFQFLIRELRYEANRQTGMRTAKSNLNQLTGYGW